jgi:hypothetical protein
MEFDLEVVIAVRGGHGRVVRLSWASAAGLRAGAFCAAVFARGGRLQLFRGPFVVSAQLHFAEDALALHFFLKRLEGLIDIVVTDYDLQAVPRIWSEWVAMANETHQGSPKVAAD